MEKLLSDLLYLDEQHQEALWARVSEFIDQRISEVQSSRLTIQKLERDIELLKDFRKLLRDRYTDQKVLDNGNKG